MVSANMPNCSHIIRQCEMLKTKIQGKSQEVLNTLTEESVQRQKLADLYKSILLKDLPYSLEKKVELELWNSAFKCHIDNFRSKMKDKRQEKYETQARLSLFLDASTGFYFQLLQEFCSAYELDLPFYGKNNQLGILKKSSKCAVHKKGKLNACLYICQDCLVHLGDLARYRNDLRKAELFYVLASKVLPGNGQPYNQLAILASAKGNQPLAVFNYFKSISVPNAFPAASSNLQKTLSQLLCSSTVASQFVSTSGLEKSQFIELFLQLMACLYLLQDLDRANNLKERIASEIRDMIPSLTREELLILTSISLFNLTKYKPKDIEFQKHITEEESAIWHHILSVNVLLLQALIESTNFTLKNIAIRGDEVYKCLPSIKIIFDWIFSNNNGLFEMEEFQENPILFHHIASFGNLLLERKQLKPADKSATPLEEDWHMYGVSFLRKVNKRYDFKLQSQQMTEDEMNQLRIHRILSFLDWLILHKQASRLLTKSEIEGNTSYICLLSMVSSDISESIPMERIRSWDESSDTTGSIGDASSNASYSERSRSLFRTNSEDSNPIISSIQSSMAAPYSLFNSMWSANLHNFPQPNVGSSSIPSSTFTSMNQLNSPSVLPISSNNASNLHSACLPKHSVTQAFMEKSNQPPNITPSQVLLEKETLNNVPVYQHFNPPPPPIGISMGVGIPPTIPEYHPHIGSPNQLLPSNPNQLGSSSLVSGFKEMHQASPPQQSFGVIGQNMRMMGNSSLFPVHVQRPSLPTVPPVRPDPGHARGDPLGQDSMENRSIWSSNFAIGQGELSPLEQLLQEQKRHQRVK